MKYEVLNAAKSGVSEANAYYTHTARVTKSGSGYNVTLTLRLRADRFLYATFRGRRSDR
ncbi:hypothetical protein ACW189_05150 [Limosilactobacillus fermentum]